jgi:hypothetical protein
LRGNSATYTLKRLKRDPAVERDALAALDAALAATGGGDSRRRNDHQPPTGHVLKRLNSFTAFV